MDNFGLSICIAVTENRSTTMACDTVVCAMGVVLVSGFQSNDT